MIDLGVVHDDIGRGSFLAVYFATGALGSYLSLTVNVLQRFLITTSVGASGAVMGVIAAWLSYHSEYVVLLWSQLSAVH